MTFKESLSFYDSLNKRIYESLSPPLVQVAQLQQDLCSGLSVSLEAAQNAIIRLAEVQSQQSFIMSNKLAELATSVANMMSDVYPALESALHLAAENAMAISESLTESVAYSMSSAINAAIRYAPEEMQAEYSESISPKLHLQKKQRLSLGDLLSLLSFVLALYTTIITTLPDQQLERISEQNNRLVVIEAQKAESEAKQTKDLVNTISALSDAIILLSDEVETLREQIQNSDDFVQPNDQKEDGNTLQDGD